VADDGVIRELKHPQLIGRKFSATNQPAHNGSTLKKRVFDVLDRLGCEAELMKLARGTIEEKKIFWGLVARYIPQEITGALDSTITVKVVTQLSADAPALPPDA